ncbi:MAG: hypothetical protein K2X75_03615 [Burkholderiaceae bacterium]|jgi:hypothetical protein|nr:hypothetical protein [Burkholderiaceae bacterium]
MMGRSTLLSRGVLALAAALSLSALPAAAQYSGYGSQTSASFSLGTGEQFGQDYTVISGRYGRFFVDQFEASIGLELWRGNSPSIYKIIPELRYVSATGQTFKPYAAVFLSRTIYSNDVSSHNSYGVRGGMYYVLDRSAYIGAGLVHERQESCDRGVMTDCNETRPEVTLHFRF